MAVLQVNSPAVRDSSAVGRATLASFFFIKKNPTKFKTRILRCEMFGSLGEFDVRDNQKISFESCQIHAYGLRGPAAG